MKRYLLFLLIPLALMLSGCTDTTNSYTGKVIAYNYTGDANTTYVVLEGGAVYWLKPQFKPIVGKVYKFILVRHDILITSSTNVIGMIEVK